MRIAAVVAAVLLTAACSSQQATVRSTQNESPAATAGAADPSGAPSGGTPVAQVIAWVRAAATAVDVSRYQSQTGTDGTVTRLPSDIAFVSPSGKINCVTELRYGDTDLECLANLKNPPPRPPNVADVAWNGDWIEYQGGGATVGSFHGDPGPFALGRGARLPYGSLITFRGYSCRMDEAGLFCVNPEAQSGVKISDSGLVPFGCLQQNPDATKNGVGQMYRC